MCDLGVRSGVKGRGSNRAIEYSGGARCSVPVLQEWSVSLVYAADPSEVIRAAAERLDATPDEAPPDGAEWAVTIGGTGPGSWLAGQE